MPVQSVRAAARRAALEAQQRLRVERAAREKRVSDLGVAVSVALAQRDEWVTRCERAAGEALRTMTAQEGLSLRAAAAWCGRGMSAREAARLRQAAEQHEQERSLHPAVPRRPPVTVRPAVGVGDGCTTRGCGRVGRAGPGGGRRGGRSPVAVQGRDRAGVCLPVVDGGGQWSRARAVLVRPGEGGDRALIRLRRGARCRPVERGAGAGGPVRQPVVSAGPPRARSGFLARGEPAGVGDPEGAHRFTVG